MQELLDQDQLETLSELFNIGVGKAAAVLSEMVDEEVSLSVPFIECKDFDKALEQLQASTTAQVDAVEQSFNGTFSGIACLLFSEKSSFLLVQRLLGTEVPLDELTEMEHDALKEIGNIILNACFGTISDILHVPLESGLPKLISGTCADALKPITAEINQDPIALIMRVSFSLPSGEIDGNITYIMTADSAQNLAKALDKYVSQVI
jgi:chemotaxis protein CheC